MSNQHQIVSAREVGANRVQMHCMNRPELEKSMPPEAIPYLYKTPTLTIVSSDLINSTLEAGVSIEEIRHRSLNVARGLREVLIDFRTDHTKLTKHYPDRQLIKLRPTKETRSDINLMNEALDIVFPEADSEYRLVQSKIVIASIHNLATANRIEKGILRALPLSLTFGMKN